MDVEGSLSFMVPCKCDTLVLTNSQPPTSPPITLHKANCRCQFADPEEMDSLIS